jgi:hypothetical protein
MQPPCSPLPSPPIPPPHPTPAGPGQGLLPGAAQGAPGGGGRGHARAAGGAGGQRPAPGHGGQAGEAGVGAAGGIGARRLRGQCLPPTFLHPQIPRMQHGRLPPTPPPSPQADVKGQQDKLALLNMVLDKAGSHAPLAALACEHSELRARNAAQQARADEIVGARLAAEQKARQVSGRRTAEGPLPARPAPAPSSRGTPPAFLLGEAPAKPRLPGVSCPPAWPAPRPRRTNRAPPAWPAGGGAHRRDPAQPGVAAALAGARRPPGACGPAGGAGRAAAGGGAAGGGAGGAGARGGGRRGRAGAQHAQAAGAGAAGAQQGAGREEVRAAGGLAEWRGW